MAKKNEEDNKQDDQQKKLKKKVKRKPVTRPGQVTAWWIWAPIILMVIVSIYISIKTR